MTDTKAPPERIWIPIVVAEASSDELLAKSDVCYVRADLASRSAAVATPDARAAEAVERLSRFINDDYTLIARHFKETTKNRDIGGDVEDLIACCGSNSAVKAGAEAMRDACVEKVQEIADARTADETPEESTKLNSILSHIIVALEQVQLPTEESKDA